MAEAKTQPTAVPVAEYLAGIADPSRRADCEFLVELMRRVTGAEPVMWGAGIVGFGRYRYHYASGHSGEWPLTGFAARKGDLSVYLVAEGANQSEQLAHASVAEVRRRYPD